MKKEIKTLQQRLEERAWKRVREDETKLVSLLRNNPIGAELSVLNQDLGKCHIAGSLNIGFGCLSEDWNKSKEYAKLEALTNLESVEKNLFNYYLEDEYKKLEQVLNDQHLKK